MFLVTSLGFVIAIPENDSDESQSADVGRRQLGKVFLTRLQFQSKHVEKLDVFRSKH